MARDGNPVTAAHRTAARARVVETTRALHHLRAQIPELARARREAITYAREVGVTWEELASACGVSRRALTMAMVIPTDKTKENDETD